MKTLRLLLALPLLAACATLGVGRSSGDAARQQLWVQAFNAYSHDSLRVAQSLYQRLAAEHPRTREGHEARYFLGLLSLDPRLGPNPLQAEQQLTVYLAEDSVRELQGSYRREATSLRRLAQQLRAPCGERAGTPLACDTALAATRPAQPQPGENAPSPAAAAELARLRRAWAERGDTIRDLRTELERIRNTLAPRRPDD